MEGERGGEKVIILIKLEQHTSPDIWVVAMVQDGVQGGMVLVMMLTRGAM